MTLWHKQAPYSHIKTTFVNIEILYLIHTEMWWAKAFSLYMMEYDSLCACTYCFDPFK